MNPPQDEATTGDDETKDHTPGVPSGPITSAVVKDSNTTLAPVRTDAEADPDATGGWAGSTVPGRVQLDAGAPLHRPSDSGRYTIYDEIARGGMGAVLRGRDAGLGRELAVKVLLEHNRTRPEVLKRFIEEAQIGGQLQHPGIVPVYDLGTLDDQRPFFAMKLVRGRTLSQMLREREKPSDALPRFLGIFEQVAQTLAYAHAKGVIHRDLKPSNIMVGAFGEVQVMDWGLAKVLDRDLSASPDSETGEEFVRTFRSQGVFEGSVAGSIMGTPAYMAPEQARGESERIDERADVFGLGAILCEILTGKPPFVGADTVEVLAKASRGDTSDALARLADCGADTELIALARENLAADPEARPRDAGVVAVAMSAYLTGVQDRLRASELATVEAQARAEEEAKRARVERDRRRLTVGLAASVLALAGVGGLSFTYVLQQRQARATIAARVLSEATTLRDQARERHEDPSRWQTALASAKQAEQALGTGGDPSIRRQLAALRDEIQAGAEAADRDRTLLNRLVDIRSAKADDSSGQTTDAAYAEAFREAGLDLSALSPEEAGARIKARPPAVALAAALDDWATLRRRQRHDPDGARRLASSARVADPDPWREELRDAMDQPVPTVQAVMLQNLARSARSQDLGAISLNLLGTAMAATDPAGAEAVLRNAQQRHPGDVWINYGLGRVLEKLHRRDDAIRFYTAARSVQPETAHELAHALEARRESDESIAVFQDLARLQPKNGRHMVCLGEALRAHGRTEEAVAVLDAAVVVCREAVQLKPDFGGARFEMGYVLHARGNLDQAVAEYREAIRLQPDLAAAYANLGAALKQQGKFDEAIVAHREAVRLEPDESKAHSSLGIALAAAGKTVEAIAEYQEAIRLNPENDVPHANLGNALLEQRKFDEAIAEYREAIRLKPNAVSAHSSLGVALRQQGKLDEAGDSLREALRLDPFDATTHTRFGNVLKEQGKIDEAVASYQEAVRLNPKDALHHMNLGTGLRLQKKYEEAVAAYQEAIRIEPKDPSVYSNLGNVLQDQGKLEEAIAALREAVRLKPDLAVAHNNLAGALKEQGKLDEALASCREAVRLRPDIGVLHATLASVLKAQGELDEALASYHQAAKLIRPRTPMAKTVADEIRQIEQTIALTARLPAVIKGDDVPKTADEALALGEICREKALYASAVRLWSAALSLDPKLADDRKAQPRYNAACLAALAVGGKGKDDPAPDEAARTKLRQQALAWLIAERDALAKLLESAPDPARPGILRILRHWQTDADLASIRDAEALAKLPPEEQKAWRNFWSGVAALVKKASPPDS